MVKRQYVVEVLGGTPLNNLWCEVCNTLGAFQIEMFVLGSRGPQHIGTVEQCVRCDYDENEG